MTCALQVTSSFVQRLCEQSYQRSLVQLRENQAFIHGVKLSFTLRVVALVKAVLLAFVFCFASCRQACREAFFQFSKGVRFERRQQPSKVVLRFQNEIVLEDSSYPLPSNAPQLSVQAPVSNRQVRSDLDSSGSLLPFVAAVEGETAATGSLDEVFKDSTVVTSAQTKSVRAKKSTSSPVLLDPAALEETVLKPCARFWSTLMKGKDAPHATRSNLVTDGAKAEYVALYLARLLASCLKESVAKNITSYYSGPVRFAVRGKNNKIDPLMERERESIQVKIQGVTTFEEIRSRLDLGYYVQLILTRACPHLV